MTEAMVVLPDPKRMIEGLRDTGYEFNTAVADIIDNSIAAEATKVDISIEMDYRGKIIISVADNGYGMNRADLINAMKYGSDRRPNPSSLGKFGLGLKTASTAFCRRLSVVSRSSGDEALLEATWDLDHVADKGKWEILLSETPDGESVKHLERIAPNCSGTVVAWNNIDRVMRTYKDPGGRHAQKALEQLAIGLTEHVAMIYQRFLDPEDTRAENVEIRLNDEAILAWDPFCRSISDLVGNKVVPIEMEGGKEAQFTIKAYILPRKDDFPDEESAKSANLGNERQGIYIYRENRLIHDADWLGMYSKEPHGTLLRVEFSFNHLLDEAFHIDIKKSQIILNTELWNWLKDEFLTAPRREADRRYRHGIKRQAKESAIGSHKSSNTNIKAKENELDTAEVEVVDSETGDCKITNKQGQFRLKLKVGNALNPGEVFVQPIDGLDDNALFEPAIIEQHNAVRINTSHPYYHKVYVPNLSRGVTVQGMDSLLWALCAAELSTISDTTAKHFEEMRFEVSRLLRKLVVDLPEPEFEDNDKD